MFWGGVQHGFNGFTHDPVKYAMHIDCPVLHLHGAQDPRVNREQAETVFQAFAGPKQLEVFEDVGHGSCAAAQPARWQSVVDEFLTRHVESPRPHASSQ